MLFLLIASFLAASFAKSAGQFDVLINEIAWTGSLGSANDEWIELANNTDKTINVGGWSLKSADGKLKINLQGQIPAKGFYLAERTDDSSLPETKADLIYAGALDNGGLDLILYDDSSNLIDRANYSTGWPAGNNTTKQTMERTGLSTWQTSQNPNGTPKLQNSAGDTVSVLPKTAKTYFGGVVINEIMPQPDGPDETNEWVELYNKNSFSVDLSGWKLKDATGIIGIYVFPENIWLSANSYMVLKRPETKIILNNETDGLSLAHPDGNIIDSVSYQKSLVDYSYIRTTSGWKWSLTPTPGTQNNTSEKTKSSPPPKNELSGNVNIAASLPNNPIDLSEVLSQKKDINPWVLFLIVGGATLAAGIAIVIWKIKDKI